MSWKTLISKLGDSITTGSEEIRFCCPFCFRKGKPQDHDYHLYMNPTKEVYICFRCGSKGKFESLFKYFDIEYDSRLINVRRKEIAEYDYHELKYPRALLSPRESTQVMDYLTSRMSERDIDFYMIKWDAISRLIVFPICQSGKLVYWITRTYDSRSKRQYRNAPAPRGYFLYNLQNVTPYDHVIICEGIFSCVSMGYNAVATLGKQVTDTQLSMLMRLKKSKYILAFDNDATGESIRVASRLSLAGSVYLLSLPKGKDPNDIGRPEIAKRLQTHCYPFGGGELRFCLDSKGYDNG